MAWWEKQHRTAAKNKENHVSNKITQVTALVLRCLSIQQTLQTGQKREGQTNISILYVLRQPVGMRVYYVLNQTLKSPVELNLAKKKYLV